MLCYKLQVTRPYDCWIKTNMNGKDKCRLNNWFGFDEDDIITDVKNDSNRNITASLCEGNDFCADRPYRLSLSTQPFVKRKKIDKDLSTLKKPGGCQNTLGKTVLGEHCNAAAFDSPKNVKSPRTLAKSLRNGNSSKPKLIQTKLNLIKLNNKKLEVPSLSETANLKSLVFDENESSFNSRVNRSYQKKLTKKRSSAGKQIEQKEALKTETETEKPAKVTKPRKRPLKEDEEYDEWAKGINSAFEDVDNFNLSINYE